LVNDDEGADAAHSVRVFGVFSGVFGDDFLGGKNIFARIGASRFHNFEAQVFLCARDPEHTAFCQRKSAAKHT